LIAEAVVEAIVEAPVELAKKQVNLGFDSVEFETRFKLSFDFFGSVGQFEFLQHRELITIFKLLKPPRVRKYYSSYYFSISFSHLSEFLTPVEFEFAVQSCERPHRAALPP
jgi:hypothetical protein